MRGRMFSGRPSNSDCNGPLRSLKSVKLAIQPTEYESYGKSSLHSFYAAFFWRCLSMMRRHYVRRYGTFGTQVHYRIRPATTPRTCSDVRKAGRWGLSLETQ
jgi:hypothetical protein